MNLLFGVPALAGPGRLKAGHHTDGTTQTGSWSQCTRSKSWGLSMNLGWFGVPPSGGANGLDRLKPGLQAVSGFTVPMHAEKTKGRSPRTWIGAVQASELAGRVWNIDCRSQSI